LATPNGRSILVENKLLSGQGPSGHIQPAVLQSALHQPQAEASSNADEREPARPADCAPVGHHRDWIKYDSADSRCKNATENSVFTFFRRLAHDSIHQAARCPEDHPGYSPSEPKSRVSFRRGSELDANSYADRIDHVRTERETKSEHKTKRKGENAAQGRFFNGTFDRAFRDREPKRHQSDNQGKHQDVAPALGVRSIDKARFRDRPPR